MLSSPSVWLSRVVTADTLLDCIVLDVQYPDVICCVLNVSALALVRK